MEGKACLADESLSKLAKTAAMNGLGEVFIDVIVIWTAAHAVLVKGTGWFFSGFFMMNHLL